MRVEIWAHRATSVCFAKRIPVGHSGLYGKGMITNADLRSLKQPASIVHNSRAGVLTDAVVIGCITLLVSEHEHEAVLLTSGSKFNPHHRMVGTLAPIMILIVCPPFEGSPHRVLFVFHAIEKMWLSYDTENGDHREMALTQHTRILGGTVPFQYAIVDCPGQNCGCYSGDFVVAFAFSVIRYQQIPELATSNSCAFGSAMRSFIAKTIYCNNLTLTIPEQGDCFASLAEPSLFHLTCRG